MLGDSSTITLPKRRMLYFSSALFLDGRHSSLSTSCVYCVWMGERGGAHVLFHGFSPGFLLAVHDRRRLSVLCFFAILKNSPSISLGVAISIPT